MTDEEKIIDRLGEVEKLAERLDERSSATHGDIMEVKHAIQEFSNLMRRHMDEEERRVGEMYASINNLRARLERADGTLTAIGRVAFIAVPVLTLIAGGMAWLWDRLPHNPTQ